MGEPAEGALGAPLLEAEGLRKAYGARTVVDSASLRLLSGEGLALLGPNGSGKTTLLSLLSGALPPDAGCARVCSRSVAQPAGRRRLGFVPQELALYEELTGAENVALFGRLSGLSRRALADGVRAALEAADLWQERERRAGTYSGGMRRRLSVACALVHSPAVLLLDEPFVGIDEESRARLFEVLQAKKRAGLGLVLSTHRLDEVAALCDRFLLLTDGRIVGERIGLLGDGPEQRARGEA